MKRIRLITVSLAAAALAIAPAAAFARHGADDPAGHVRHAKHTATHQAHHAGADDSGHHAGRRHA